MTDKPMTYAGSGVDYGNGVDEFKRECQQAASQTAGNIRWSDGRPVEDTRGESSGLVEYDDRYETLVLECLGTKVLVADELFRLTGVSHHDAVAIDVAAMIFNDVAMSGARPDKVTLYVAAGSSEWFHDKVRRSAFTQGWKRACDTVGCYWIGGETPVLSGIVMPDAVDLAGASTGVIKPKHHRIDAANLRDGDAIVMVASSGVHANGLSMARRVAEKIGLEASLPDGRTFGEALLTPTHLYTPVILACQKAGISLHYASNITGHGLSKVMRAPQPFVYTLTRVATPHPEFDCIREYGPVTLWEMYHTFNMGNGLALFVDSADVKRTIAAAASPEMWAWEAGYIEKRGDEKKVIIEPLGLEYDESTLGVR